MIELTELQLYSNWAPETTIRVIGQAQHIMEGGGVHPAPF